MRVCVVIASIGSLVDTSAPPTHGGMEVQLFALAERLCEHEGFEVEIATRQPPNRDVADCGMPIRQMPQVPKSRLPGVAAIASVLAWRRLLKDGDYDVVIQSAASRIVGHIAAACQMSGVGFVYRVASDQDIGGEILAAAAARRTFMWGLRRASLVLATSESQRERLAGDGVKAVVLPKGLPVPPSPLEEGRTVLWVGSGRQLKRPEIFIELAERLPGLEFVMLMPPRDPGYAEQVAEAADKVTNLALIPGVPLDEVQGYFDRAALYVNTSRFEGGIPFTFLQAGFGSIPVISLDVNPDGVLEAEGIGWHARGDVEALAKLVEECMSNEPLRRDAGTRNRAYVEKEHDIAGVGNRLAALLERRFGRGR